MDNKAKVQMIKEKGAETRLRHSGMSCVVYECKFDVSHLSKEKERYLNKLFLEAKWLYNDILSQEDLFKYDTKTKVVSVLNKEREPEERKLEVISSQMKQSIFVRLKDNVINLSKAKAKGIKVGKLDFKSRVWSIPLVQYQATYKINKNYVTLQGFKKPFNVMGLNQIPSGAEITNATLVKRNNNYYIMVTCFKAKEKRVKTGKVVGLDFGIRDNITTSDDEVFNIDFPTSIKTRRLQRFLKNKVEFSRNWNKQKVKIAGSHEETKRKRKDVRNKVVSHLTKMYDVVCFQDENIHEWQSGLYGKQVSKSAMGGIISDLKRKSETPVMIDKWFPSTKLCPDCGRKNNIGRNDKVYTCECGYTEKRDLHAARNVRSEGLRVLSVNKGKTGAGAECISWGSDARNACGDSDLYLSVVGASKLEPMRQEAPSL